ncbi:MAG: hypothetical protein DI537_35380 [Stutzerimonas stutzeri]|nr:MAG: hypothetical protein DI537_35380 [Stutzerimonas stutzeri]
MPFRKLFASPQDLQKLATAIDEAWIAVNNVDPIGPEDRTSAQYRLAQILMQLWKENPFAGNLAERAATEFTGRSN